MYDPPGAGNRYDIVICELSLNVSCTSGVYMCVHSYCQINGGICPVKNEWRMQVENSGTSNPLQAELY